MSSASQLAQVILILKLNVLRTVTPLVLGKSGKLVTFL